MAVENLPDDPRRRLLCFFYGGSIIGSLLVYGLWQERIMALPYQPHYDFFNISVFLVLFNRVFGFIFAFGMLGVAREPCGPSAPLWKYALISLSTVVASTCQYEALKYVSFTVQVLGKSFKMMPVMLWGVLWFRRKHRILDWIVAGLVTCGVVCFMLAGNISPEYRSEVKNSTLYGIGLLMAFIVLDGFTSSFQESLFADNRTSKYNQMYYINLCSAAISAAALYGSGGFPEAVAFCHAHPMVWVDVCVLSGSAVVAQWFIYSQVQEFGAVTFAATMNLRQVFSVLGSYLLYHRSAGSITPLQIAGLVVVFAALGCQSLAGFRSSGAASERRRLLPPGRGGCEDAGAMKPKEKASNPSCPPFCRAV